jgi:hypothetical protein
MKRGMICEYSTYREYLKHPKFLNIRSIVLSQASFICQVCNSEPATQVHHVRYPPWGTFDVPENLIAICHRCHYEVHKNEI